MRRRLWVPLSLLLAAALLFSACGSRAGDAEEAVGTLFSLLRQGKFSEASACFLPADDGSLPEIADTSFNRTLFAGIEAEVWHADKNEVKLYVTQKSMYSVYASAMDKIDGISLETDAGRLQWAGAVKEALNETTDTAVFAVTVPFSRENGTVRLKMTDEFRNALFGGELDAINAFEKIGESTNG